MLKAFHWSHWLLANHSRPYCILYSRCIKNPTLLFFVPPYFTVFAFVYSDLCSWNLLQLRFVHLANSYPNSRSGWNITISATLAHPSHLVHLSHQCYVWVLYTFITAHVILIVNKSYALADSELPEGRDWIPLLFWQTFKPESGHLRYWVQLNLLKEQNTKCSLHPHFSLGSVCIWRSEETPG